MVHDGASEMALEHHARKLGPGIRDDGRERVLAGYTSLEEFVRVIRDY